MGFDSTVKIGSTMILCMQGPHTVRNRRWFIARRSHAALIAVLYVQHGHKKSTENKAQLSALGMGFAVVVTSQYIRDIPVCWGHPSVLGTSRYIRDIRLAHKLGLHEASRPHETDEEDFTS